MKTLRFNTEDIARGHLILVNSFHPVKSDVSKSYLVSVNSDAAHILLENQTAKMLSKVTDLLKCNHDIVPVSGYRAMSEQQEIYANSLREHGDDFTQKYVAFPGCSEHQTGLAIDLAKKGDSIDFIRPDFPYNGICERFRKYSIHYGFIERYPVGRELITCIAHEPWHFRYVGYPHSETMTKKNLTLEEYTEYLKQFTYNGNHFCFRSHSRDFEIFYVPVHDNKKAVIEISNKISYQVSGNNVDGVVVTLCKEQL